MNWAGVAILIFLFVLAVLILLQASRRTVTGDHASWGDASLAAVAVAVYFVFFLPAQQHFVIGRIGGHNP